MSSSRALSVVFALLPAFGHTYPVLPLAQACRDAGHRVLIVTDPEFAPRFAVAGFEVAVVDSSIDQAAQELMRGGFNFRALPPDEVWRFGSAMFGDVLARRVAAGLAPLLERERPDLVVYDEMNLGAALAAGLAGVPAVRHGLGPWPPAPMQEEFARLLEGHWERAGRTPPCPSRIFGELQLDVWPAALRQSVGELPTPSTAVRPTSWDAPDTAPPELLSSRDRQRPLVYVTLGTVFFGAVDVLRAALTGLADLDVDVLASVGPGGTAVLLEDGELPANATVADFVAQGAVLSAADAVVHHGGAGTTLGALSAGLPQLVMPQRAHDQFINAGVVTATGAGLALMPPQVSAATIGEAVEGLLHEPGFRLEARARSEEIRSMPSPAEVVGALEAVVAGSRSAADLAPAGTALR